MNIDKDKVYDFWNQASCGEELYLSGQDKFGYIAQSEERYRLEPYILEFSGFEKSKGLRVLEIGVGLGADHQKFAEAGAVLYGIDLTERAVEHTSKRLAEFGLNAKVKRGDAESLEFQDGFFDQVYSWGVLHHSPNTPTAISEVWRVLKIGGIAKIMIYHKYSIVGYMLWFRYAFLMLRPWMTLERVYSLYLESPGTKAYSIKEAYKLCSDFNNVRIKVVLTHGDLLESGAGQRHRGWALSFARAIWPRRLIRKIFPNAGLFMLIEARK